MVPDADVPSLRYGLRPPERVRSPRTTTQVAISGRGAAVGGHYGHPRRLMHWVLRNWLVAAKRS
jgi:hypothetical protein